MLAAKKDILFADEDKDDFTVLKSAVKETSIPFSLRYAKNGEMLLVQLREKIPDLLLIDIHTTMSKTLSDLEKKRNFESKLISKRMSLFIWNNSKLTIYT